MREFVKTHRLFALYTVLVLLIIFVALAAPMLAPQDPYESGFFATFSGALAGDGQAGPGYVLTAYLWYFHFLVYDHMSGISYGWSRGNCGHCFRLFRWQGGDGVDAFCGYDAVFPRRGTGYRYCWYYGR